MIAFTFILSIASCTKDTEEKTIEIKYLESMAIEDVQPPVYLKFQGVFGGGRLSFELRSQAGLSPRDDPKYALGGGALGDTVTMGRTTTSYDSFGRPSSTAGEVFLRFEIVSFDEETRVVKIRVLPSPEEKSDQPT